MALAVRKLGPDATPRSLAELPPVQPPIRHLFRAVGGGGVHVATAGKALVEVGIAYTGNAGKLAPRFGIDGYVHSPNYIDSLDDVQANRYNFRTREVGIGVLQDANMETASERRRRKLEAICKEHGITAVATQAQLNPFSLEQIIKGVLLPPKVDGTRSPRQLGDRAARAIESAFGLGEGWFDAPESRPELNLPAEALVVAQIYAAMTPDEQQRFRIALLNLKNDQSPTVKGAPVQERRQGERRGRYLGDPINANLEPGDTGFGDNLDEEDQRDRRQQGGGN